MSRLAPALRIRGRQLDALRLAIASEQQRTLDLSRAADDLSSQRLEERRRAFSSPLTSDAWFAASARSLEQLSDEQGASAAKLAILRDETRNARARLSLLEEAERSARAAATRALEGRTQAMLDDRTAACWARRR